MNSATKVAWVDATIIPLDNRNSAEQQNINGVVIYTRYGLPLADEKFEKLTSPNLVHVFSRPEVPPL